ncbi:hypothetical protein O6H91_05G125200 [Diphasiastrum complanatum]|uniref:Uncharacterized protein n=1 Tax=Diphasiastrum complanatum TaxID=34168 RepID=A0ACC2DT21_DIPCM|nr:hypothetical protein O6H91_Y268500 [Diphasiastrum complanatum]KAJ7294288.1 hypothetical protein O6H91_Y268500 [Diphasiastrum complanatum]KAJ7557401.1 hypothetical protein O6H91_05G125200 [Diphasiastrum complanatum]
MRWAYPSIDLEEVVRLAGAFLDMLVLGSGYQSSGWPVFWSPQQVLKALRWASLFESIIHQLPSNQAGEGQRQALDEALHTLMAKTPHPAGLPQLNCTLLSDAKKLLIKVMVQAMGIDNGQLGSVFAAILQSDRGICKESLKRKVLGEKNEPSKRKKGSNMGIGGGFVEFSVECKLGDGATLIEGHTKQGQSESNVRYGLPMGSIDGARVEYDHDNRNDSRTVTQGHMKQGMKHSESNAKYLLEAGSVDRAPIECSHDNRNNGNTLIEGHTKQGFKRSERNVKYVLETGLTDRAPVEDDHANRDDPLLTVVVEGILERYSFKSTLGLLSKAVGMALSSLTAPETVPSRSNTIWMDDHTASPARSSENIGCCLSRNFYYANAGFVKCYCTRWRKQSLLYLSAVENMYKLSGALLIFKEDCLLWTRVFDSLQKSIPACTEEARSVEIAELCCLYLASNRWKGLYKTVLSIPCFHGFSESYLETQAQTDPFLPVNCTDLVPLTTEKRQEIEDFMLGLFGQRYHLWWKLPPVLAAAALADGSPLMEHYRKAILNHLEAKISSESCPCHSCCQSQYCEACEGIVCERIWCMAIQTGQFERMQSAAEFAKKSFD